MSWLQPLPTFFFPICGEVEEILDLLAYKKTIKPQ